MRPVFSRDPNVERSLRHSIRDGIAFSVMTGGGESYFSAFALYLKATTAEVGILSTLPVLAGSFAQLLSVFLGERLGNRKALIVGGALLQTAIWIPLVVLPLLFPRYSLAVLLLCLIAYYAAGNLVTPQWTSLMGDLVPEQRRGRYFGRRSRLASITGFLALAGAGLSLHLFSGSGFPASGFFVVFGVAALARAISAYHLTFMHEPTVADGVPDTGRFARPGASFARFSLFYGLMQFGVGIGGPFFNVYMLRDLELSYLAFMALLAVAVLAQFLTLGIWGRLSDAFGNRLLLRITGAVVPLVPVVWLFGTDFRYLLGVQVLSGVVWGGFTLAAGNFVYELVPEQRRATWIASHNIAANIGLFGGAVLGGWLATVPNLPGPGGLLSVFLLSGLVRLTVAAALLPRVGEARQCRRLSAGRLAFLLTGSRRLLRLLRRRSRAPSQPAPVVVT